jgi:hypothetical protein
MERTKDRLHAAPFSFNGLRDFRISRFCLFGIYVWDFGGVSPSAGEVAARLAIAFHSIGNVDVVECR